jgi:hypothetical protein
VGIVDRGAVEPADEIGGQSQHRHGLVGIGNQVDHDLPILLQGRNVGRAGSKQRQRIGVVGGILEKKFGRYVAAERRIERQHAETRRRSCRRASDHRLDLRSLRIGGLGGGDVTQPLPDAADPVQAFGIGGVEGHRPLEMPDRRFGFVELETGLAKLVMQPAIQRPFSDQFAQQRPRQDELLRRRQRLDQVGPRRPMAGIKLERLEIQRDRVLRLAGVELRIAEIAPAADQMRRQPQRDPVVCGRRFEIAANQEGVAEDGMQIGRGIGRYLFEQPGNPGFRKDGG